MTSSQRVHSDDLVVEPNLNLFSWRNKQHQQHLQGCLSCLPADLVNLAGNLAGIPELEWVRSEGYVLYADHTGFQRIAQHGSKGQWISVMSNIPLSFSLSSSSPSSSSPSSSSWSIQGEGEGDRTEGGEERKEPPSSSVQVVSFTLCIDQCDGDIVVGVCRSLPLEGCMLSQHTSHDDDIYGDADDAIGYHSYGYMYQNGSVADRGSFFGVGDEISVQVDYDHNIITFFRNGKQQGSVTNVCLDMDNPSNPHKQKEKKQLYACVCMGQSGDQVTLLSTRNIL